MTPSPTSSNEEYTATSAAGYSTNYTKTKTKQPSPSKTQDRGNVQNQSKSRDNGYTANNNPCKHCKMYGLRNHHPHVLIEQCFWKKKRTGFGPQYCCTIMEVCFKPRHRFSAKLGRYDDDTDSGEETE